MLGGNPAPGSSPATNLLYAGEQFDTSLQMYYNRARYYDQNIGRFNRMDPYAGNKQDPQSLHKYLYVHNNPVNGIDPAGLFTQAFGYLAEAAIQGVYQLDHPFDNVLYGKWTRIPGAFRLKPDIFNISKQSWLEVKPLSLSGVVRGTTSFLKYSVPLAPFGYFPEVTWQPSTPVLWVGGVQTFFFNAGGIVFYTDAVDNMEDLLVLTSVAAVKQFVRSPAGRRLVLRTVVGVFGRIPTLVKARIAIDSYRLENHFTIGSLFATLGIL